MESEEITYFRNRFGKGDSYREFTQEDSQRIQNRVSPLFNEILASDGWSSYNNQVFWLCDPDEWEGVTELWFEYGSKLTTFARSAFGDMFVWDGEWIWNVRVHDSIVMRLIDDVDWFLSQTITSSDFATQTHLKSRTKNANDMLGRIKSDEIYSYVPAIKLGGSYEASDVSKVGFQEGISFLAQLSTIEYML